MLNNFSFSLIYYNSYREFVNLSLMSWDQESMTARIERVMPVMSSWLLAFMEFVTGQGGFRS